MNDTIKNQWVAALRSGKYKQTTGRLKGPIAKEDDGREIFGYCCLGVLCDLYSKETRTQWHCVNGGTGGDHGIEGAAQILPEKISGWASIEDANPTVKYAGKNVPVAELNDNGEDFELIADLIEEQL